MTTINRLMREAQVASADYATAKRALAEAQAAHRLGLRNDLLTATAIEHSAYHRWKNALATLNA